MKKILSAFLAAAFFTCSVQCNEQGEKYVPIMSLEAEIAAANSFTLTEKLPVRSCILIEQSTGRVLYEQDADEKLPPASVTKIMTLLLVMEAIDSGKISINDKVVCSDLAASYGGSQIWLKPGEEMTVDELLKATAIASANDATVALAEFVAGSQSAFISEMNKRAAELGMKNTVFKCVEGLDTQDHLTTSRDIAIMSRELMKHSLIKKYSTIWMDSLRGGQTELVNTNRLVRFYEGATGLKTGTTDGAGSCLSATAERNGLGLVAVVMGASTSDIRFASARALLDWGFANYTSVQLEPINHENITVTGGTSDSLALESNTPSGIVVEKNRASLIERSIDLPQNIAAPIEKGAEVGKVTVKIGDEIITEYPIIAAQSIDKMSFGKAFSILIKNLLTLK